MHNLIQKLLNRHGDKIAYAGVLDSQRIIKNAMLPMLSPADPASPEFVDAATFEVGPKFAMVVYKWEVRGLATVPNPHWVGTMTIPISPYDLQGRIWYYPIKSGKNCLDEIKSDLNDIPFQNTPPAIVPNSVGISILREYSTHRGDPFLIIESGQVFGIRVWFGDPAAGLTPPPAPLELQLAVEYSAFLIPFQHDGDYPVQDVTNPDPRIVTRIDPLLDPDYGQFEDESESDLDLNQIWGIK